MKRIVDDLGNILDLSLSVQNIFSIYGYYLTMTSDFYLTSHKTLFNKIVDKQAMLVV